VNKKSKWHKSEPLQSSKKIIVLIFAKVSYKLDKNIGSDGQAYFLRSKYYYID
jgi:hypothetical protein